jgi:ribonuclease D
VLNDQVLIDAAILLPKNHADLAAISGMNSGQINRHGEGILAAVRRGLHVPPLYAPRPPRPSDAYLERLDALRNWRKKTALEMGVASDVVLPRDLLTDLAEQNPRRPDELAQVMSSAPWRLEHFGSRILNVLEAC